LSAVRDSPVGVYSPVIAMLVFVVLIGLTLYVGWLVRMSIRQGIRDSLQTVLTANVGALELWLSDQRETAMQIASEDSVRTVALDILRNGRRQVGENGGSVSTLQAVGGAPRVLQKETDRIRSAGYLGWAVVDPLGAILRSSEPRFEDGVLPITRELFQRLSDGKPSVTRPLVIQLAATGKSKKTGEAGERDAVMCAIAPLSQDSKTVGAFALMIAPSHEFTEILRVAQMGDSGETYAFDRDAVLLSSSRFESQLISAGLLSEGETSPLRIHVRDPGTDLRFSKVASGEHRQSPMTRMAGSATEGVDGFDVIGYPNYRGVPVVGAWRWMPDYGFGVATEFQVDEAFVPLRILRNSFLALLGVVTIAGASLLGLAWITRPRDSRLDPGEDLNRRLGQYDLRKKIGRGGMGTVYLGSHILLDRKVAIKVLENADATERALARFRREVRLSASLTHPNTIEIYDFGRTEEGTFFYVMEFVDGISLEQLVGYYGRQPAERVIYLMLQICGSISEAHQTGMVHRDIKPANVLLTSRSGVHDLVKVLDFGLAKQIDQESMQLTRVDSLTGTPLYMAPESIRDASAADVLSDIYSIGAVGYTLLCGLAPFVGGTSIEVCAKKLHGEPERPDARIKAALADDLQEVLLRCLRLDSSRRPQSAQHLAAELLTCADSPHWTQQDAALWWREVFDGPYLDDFEISDVSPPGEGTRGDTAVNEKRPCASGLAQSTAN
jgi:serine/threonine-protein kinase